METLSNVDIVLYSLFQLGGADRLVHTEHIAYRCFCLASERFSWRLPEYHNRYPDKDRVRVSLEDARKEKLGHMVEGRAGVEKTGDLADGWRLTQNGVRSVLANQARLEKLLRTKAVAARGPDVQRVLKTFRQEKCYKHFMQRGSLDGLTEYDFRDMLLCRPDANAETVRDRFERLKTKAELTRDESIQQFLKACEQFFAGTMRQTE